MKQRAMFRRMLLILPLFVVSCSSVRVVSVEPGEGGQVAVSPRDSEDARQKAIAMMQENCGSRHYKITKEGEEVIGSSTRSTANAGRGMFGGVVMNGASSSTQKTEWRLTYKCE